MEIKVEERAQEVSSILSVDKVPYMMRLYSTSTEYKGG